MPSFNHSPVYNIKAVLKETGLKADVLRAWERRYDLLKPQRTPGGHRLYSEHDIEIVKWLRTRQEEGLSISRAIELWKEIIETDHDPLVEYSSPSTSPASEPSPATDQRIEILYQHWVEATLAFDSLKADEILNQAIAIYPVETVCTQILLKGISDIGNYWYLDKASVQQEHFATALASRRLETLIAATPRPTRLQTVLVGCPPQEGHTFSVLMLSLFLQRRGLKVVYLGANVPIEQLEETSTSIQADLIVLAAQQLSTAATLQSAALMLQSQGIPLAYGGLIFNRIRRLRERIPAYYLGGSLIDAVHQVERLVDTPTTYPTMISPHETHRGLAKLYQEERHQIEAALFEELHEMGLPSEYINEANYFFGNGLFAALELGDPAFLEADLGWVKRLISGRQISVDRLTPYLTAYSHAVRKILGEPGTPITDWIYSYTGPENAI